MSAYRANIFSAVWVYLLHRLREGPLPVSDLDLLLHQIREWLYLWGWIPEAFRNLAPVRTTNWLSLLYNIDVNSTLEYMYTLQWQYSNQECSTKQSTPWKKLRSIDINITGLGYLKSVKWMLNIQGSGQDDGEVWGMGLPDLVSRYKQRRRRISSAQQTHVLLSVVLWVTSGTCA